MAGVRSMWCLRGWMVVAASGFAAQELPGQLPRGLAMSFGVDGGRLPDALSQRCGRSRSGTLGASWFGGVRFRRPDQPFYAQIDLRLARADNGACTLEGPPIAVLSPTEYETLAGITYPAGYPRSPLGASLLRLGAEHQVEQLTAGLYAAGGYAWARHSVPLVALGARLAFGQRAFRVFVEGERARAWTVGEQLRVRRAFGPPDRELSRRTVERNEWQPWPAVRLGVTWHAR